MAANANPTPVHLQAPASSKPLPTHEIYSLQSTELHFVLEVIRSGSKTGSLTIHFSQGTPSGTLEWKERVRHG